MNTELIVVVTALSDVTAPKAMTAAIKAYSIRSCPDSSLIRRVYQEMWTLPCGNFKRFKVEKRSLGVKVISFGYSRIDSICMMHNNPIVGLSGGLIPLWWMVSRKVLPTMDLGKSGP